MEGEADWGQEDVRDPEVAPIKLFGRWATDDISVCLVGATTHSRAGTQLIQPFPSSAK